MKGNKFQKPLFGNPVVENKVEPNTHPPKRRGRPPKNKTEPEKLLQTKVSPKKGVKIGETQKIVVEKPKQQKSNVKPERGWKDFNTSKPETLRPCEFYTQDTKGKQYTFRGYILSPGCTITNDPYKLVILRKKFGNLFYKELPCLTINECPSGFPDCENCKNKKKGLKL